MGSNLVVGAKIPISLQLAKGETNKFPQAIVKNYAGTTIAGPLNLTHQGNGVYVPSTDVLMPDTPAVRVTFITYSDSGHTTEDTYYGRTTEEWALDQGSGGGSSQIVPGVTLEAEIEVSELLGEIDQSSIEGTIEKVEYSTC